MTNFYKALLEEINALPASKMAGIKWKTVPIPTMRVGSIMYNRTTIKRPMFSCSRLRLRLMRSKSRASNMALNIPSRFRSMVRPIGMTLGTEMIVRRQWCKRSLKPKMMSMDADKC